MTVQYQDVFRSIMVTKCQSGRRLDQALAKLLPLYSRSRIKKWILCKKVEVNKRIVTMPKKKVWEGELIEVRDIFEEIPFLEPQNISLNIVYEDEFIVIINKPSNFVVHPGAGNISGTLFNALLYRYPTISSVPRAGIIQRLDKDTTGLMLIAKDIHTRFRLIQSFQRREIIREYDAIVCGKIVCDGLINEPIARHVIQRTRMCVHASGKPAITHYRVIEKFSNYTKIKLRLETGRTHQIRVHMSYIRHPVFGDQKYGKSKYLANLKILLRNQENGSLLCFNRQALHASMLRFSHPITGILITCQIPLPDDMMDLLNILRLAV